jgi:metallopeptidase MepB
MHELVSRTTYSRFHGIAVVRDFVEAPSQMLENCSWIPACLRSFSSHYKTGELIPEDMIRSLVDSKHTGVALKMLGQLDYSIFDMAVHTQLMHEKELDCADFFGSIFRDLSSVKGPEAVGIKSWVVKADIRD